MFPGKLFGNLPPRAIVIALTVSTGLFDIAASLTPAAAQAVATRSVAAAPAAMAAPAQPDASDVLARTPCSRPKSVSRFQGALSRTAALLLDGKPITIVALGSSSTAGAGASSPAFHYPSRLADELRQRYPRAAITMINRGVNGEDTVSMMARLETAVLQEKPDLVLWQFGVNALLRDNDLAANVALARQGVERIKASGAEVILVDPQYVPRVLAKPELKNLLAMMSSMAEREQVSIFPRFEVMRHWHQEQALAFDRFSIADGLHLNDWGYACFAHVMSDMIEETVTRTRNVNERVLSATLHPM